MDKDVSTIDVDLELSKPYDLHQLFQTDESKKFGVYLWTIKHEEQYLVHYVGETGTSFAQRTNEHIKCLLNGHYCINDPEKLANGVRVKLWEGWWKRWKNPEFTKPSRIV